MQNLATQEGEAWRSLGRVEGAKILCEALLKKVREESILREDTNLAEVGPLTSEAEG